MRMNYNELNAWGRRLQDTARIKGLDYKLKMKMARQQYLMNRCIEASRLVAISERAFEKKRLELMISGGDVTHAKACATPKHKSTRPVKNGSVPAPVVEGTNKLFLVKPANNVSA